MNAKGLRRSSDKLKDSNQIGGDTKQIGTGEQTQRKSKRSQSIKDLVRSIPSIDSANILLPDSDVNYEMMPGSSDNVNEPYRPSIKREPTALKIYDSFTCKSDPDVSVCKRIFKEVMCVKKNVSKPIESVSKTSKTSVSTSRRMVDSEHEASIRMQPGTSKASTGYKRQICVGCIKPENEVNFMGGLGPCRGKKRSDKHPQRPTNVQKIFRMRTRNYPVMSLTENPRAAYCPVPLVEKETQNPEKLVEKVELADNIDTPTPSASTIVECEIFDMENPMNLDLQGKDYKDTYEKDEKAVQDEREYSQQLVNMKRRRIRKEIGKISEDKLRKERYAVPAVFDIDADFETSEKGSEAEENENDETKKEEEVVFPVYRRKLPDEIPVEKVPDKLAKLYRIPQKEANAPIIADEVTRREERYHQLWLRGQDKERQRAEKKEQEEKEQQENLVMDLGEQFFEEFLKDSYQECLDLHNSLPKTHVKKSFPHTIRETKHLKREMNKERIVIRDEAILKSKIFAEQGHDKDFPDTAIEIPELPPDVREQPSLSEQSSDDQDDKYVGKLDENTYQLRGFHYKLGSEPRGLIDRQPKTKLERAPRTCQTRSSWFKKLVPDMSPPAFFTYAPSTLKRNYLPNDPNIDLFPPEYSPVKEVPEAPIRQHVKSRAADGYEQSKQVRLKIKRPKYVNVKKFNLTGYMYGAKKKKKQSRKRKLRSDEQARMGTFDKFFKQVEAYDDNKAAARRRKRHNRLRFLGIPYGKSHQHTTQQKCDTSDSSSSEWIPEDDEVKSGPKVSLTQDTASNVTMGRSNYNTPPHYMTVGNMPAPKFREPTIRNHPRRQRQANKSSIVSDQFTDDSVSITPKAVRYKSTKTVLSDRAPYDVPRLAPVPPDAICPANIYVKKTIYTKLFNARYHHDHSDPTVHKEIRVKYLKKMPNLNAPQRIATEKVSRQKRPFEKAYPMGKNFKERDLSIPRVVYETRTNRGDELPQKASRRLSGGGKEAMRRGESASLAVKEKNYRSREAYENDLPGKSEYINAIRKMAGMLRQEIENIKEFGNELAVTEKEYAEEVMKEIASIESCVSTLESSHCTNFTNDSGSFLMIQDKKVPFDYITKSFVPFEEIDRVRMKADRADPIDEYNAPFYTVPFAGQKQDQVALSKATDKFYTKNQRSRIGMRKRLEVKTADFRSELLGTQDFKAPSKLATEWDENYQHELRNRPPVQPFKRKTTMIMLREGMRKQFETLYMQGHIIEQQIVQKKEIEYAEDIVKLRDMCLELFQKWQERHYHTSMLMIEKIKPYYVRTDVLKKAYHSLEKDMIKLNMRIVFIEDDWIRRTVLQNFHYLIMEQSWRLEYDWIHLQEDGTLENFRNSINNRRVVNIRKRDRDDAWAIKEYYENVYLPNKHPVEIVFPDAKSFIDGLHKLKIRTFICLLELHYSMWVLSTLQHEYNQFTRDSERFIDQTTKSVKKLGANRYFMEERAQKLEVDTKNLIGEPLKANVGSPRLRTIEPLCNMIYTKVIPQHIRNDVKADCSAIDKLKMVFGMVIDIVGKMDGIPAKRRRVVERNYRRKLEYNRQQSYQACLTEKRIQLALEEVKRNIAPPYKKPPRIGKLPRIIFKKRKVVEKVKAKVVSERNKLFIQAFTQSDEDDGGEFEDADEGILNSLQDNCIPFYFDHFLRLHDYEPNYDFKTQVELNDGPEEERLRYKDVLPEVVANLEAWKTTKKKKMEADIQKTLYLYVDDDAT